MPVRIRGDASECCLLSHFVPVFAKAGITEVNTYIDQHLIGILWGKCSHQLKILISTQLLFNLLAQGFALLCTDGILKSQLKSRLF